MDFDIKFEFFFETRKISNTRPLVTTDPEYGSHVTEIQSFGPFLPQTGNFW
jgi:hypothetical protein